MYIRVNGDGTDDLQRALREFTRRVKKSNILNEVRKRQYYLKPSEAKVVQRQESIKRRKRDEKRTENQKKHSKEY